MWLLKVLQYAFGLTLAALFLWYLLKVLTTPKKENPEPKQTPTGHEQQQ